jgi:hypothetical protein
MPNFPKKQVHGRSTLSDGIRLARDHQHSSAAGR